MDSIFIQETIFEYFKHSVKLKCYNISSSMLHVSLLMEISSILHLLVE